MTHTKLYAEEQILNQETSNIQQILNQFKQPISDKYIKLKVEEGNYQFSTNSKWKDKPNYERYGFYLEEEEEKWVQIDISPNLVENLEMEKGDDITYPFYLTIDISQKKLIRGAYTIENEEEIFIDKPVSEKNVEKELVKRLKELEKLRKEVGKLNNLQSEKEELEEKSRNLENKIQEGQEKNARLDEQIWEEARVKEELQKELEKLKNESKRNWKGFYEWMRDNVIDSSKVTQFHNVEAKGEVKIKPKFKTEFPTLDQKWPNGQGNIYSHLNLTYFWFELKQRINNEMRRSSSYFEGFALDYPEDKFTEKIRYNITGTHGKKEHYLNIHDFERNKLENYPNSYLVALEFKKLAQKYHESTLLQNTTE